MVTSQKRRFPGPALFNRATALRSHATVTVTGPIPVCASDCEGGGCGRHRLSPRARALCSSIHVLLWNTSVRTSRLITSFDDEVLPCEGWRSYGLRRGEEAGELALRRHTWREGTSQGEQRTRRADGETGHLYVWRISWREECRGEAKT